MATTIIADLPAYLLAIFPAAVPWTTKPCRPSGRAGLSGDFLSLSPESDRIVPTVNFYQTNYFADQLNLLTTNIDIKELGPAPRSTSPHSECVEHHPRRPGSAAIIKASQPKLFA